MKQKSTEEIVQTLKQVYHGGFGLKEESGNISAWYAEDGIHLAKGASAIDSPRAGDSMGGSIFALGSVRARKCDRVELEEVLNMTNGCSTIYLVSLP
ncbi:MAG: hypothetical protein ACLT46_17570 [Hungatella sp.]